MSTKLGYKKIYDFLIEKNKQNAVFSINEMSTYTGLKPTTLKVYIRNKLKNKFVENTSDGFLVINSISSMNENTFIRYLAQNTVFAKNEKDTSEYLIDNSKNAMLAAIEMHNKPLFNYRYQVVTILIINAWELLLKAYISKNMKDVKLMNDEGYTKSFEECIKCVFETLGKPYFVYRDNLAVLYDYRCRYIHYYYEGLDLLLFSLIQKSVVLYSKFIKEKFDDDLSSLGDFFILPIGFSKPISPIDYITNTSAMNEVPSEIKSFILEILEKTKTLAENSVDDTIIVPYSIHYKSENRLTNADIVAAINTQKNVNISIIEKVQITDDPNAKKAHIEEESIFRDIFTETYDDVTKYCRNNIMGFKQNNEFYSILASIKKNPELHRVRRLNINKPDSTGQDFYSKSIYEELQKIYTNK
jgi:Protein of unknown function (DUF3644).